MKALVYRGPGQKALEEKPMPVIAAATDAIVRITRTTICGTDLHILKGDVPDVTTGTILGHEGVGVVEHVGGAVSTFKPGDAVLISCITSCGKCGVSRKGHVPPVRAGWGYPRPSYRWYESRVRADSACGHEPVSDTRRH